jgi:hypothetical protein
MAHQAELAPLQAQIKAMTKKGGAVTASTNWTVNGSLAQGRTMVRDFSELLLRAYNAEADNLVRGLKPYKLDAAIERLTKVAITIMRWARPWTSASPMPTTGCASASSNTTFDEVMAVMMKWPLSSAVTSHPCG